MNKVWPICLFCVAVAGCGRGAGHLLAGLLIDEALDQAADTEAADGLDCWDLNADGECDDDDDINGDGFCDALDCRGSDGIDGLDGHDGTDGSDGAEGQPGLHGPPGPTTVIVVEPPDEPESSGPPFGHAFGHDGNHGHRP